MDPEKRSALVGAALGSALAAMGAFIVAIAVRYVPIADSDIHVPRAILGVLGAVLLAALVIASPVLLARWAARRAYARLDGGSDSSEA